MFDRRYGLVSARYAEALQASALASGQLSLVEKDSRSLLQTLSVSPELRCFLRNVRSRKDERKRVLEALFVRMELGDLFRRFVLLVAEKGRLSALEAILERCMRNFARLRGEREVQVEVARPLSAERRARLKDVLSGFFGSPDNLIRMREKVEPALLGGMVLRFGSFMIDGSLRNKLEKLGRDMRGKN